jgi:hypothetical protein
MAEDSNDVGRIRDWFVKNEWFYKKDVKETKLQEISKKIELQSSSNLEILLLKFIHHYSRELDIEEINPFFKKYLKYKNKYLQLKKNIFKLFD